MDARAWDERYAASELVWSATPNQFVAAELAALPPGRALDVAAGEGRNAIWLAERGWHVTALDFSRVGLDKGRALHTAHERGSELRIDWVLGDALTLEPDPPRFDLVVLAYLQLVEEQRREAVRRAFLTLRPGGTFFLIAHDSSNLEEGTGGPTDPAVLFTAEDVLADLDGERFEVEWADRVAREVVATVASATAHNHQGDEALTAFDALVRLVRTA